MKRFERMSGQLLQGIRLEIEQFFFIVHASYAFEASFSSLLLCHLKKKKTHFLSHYIHEMHVSALNSTMLAHAVLSLSCTRSVCS
jgi:hypothetical protein